MLAPCSTCKDVNDVFGFKSTLSMANGTRIGSRGETDLESATCDDAWNYLAWEKSWRNLMLRLFVSLIAFLGMNLCIASEADDQAKSFAKIYASLCLQNLPNLEALRQKLAPMPKLPSDQAALFLGGAPGDAWPVRDKHGKFVLTLPSGKNLCAIHARRADVGVANTLFQKMVANAPAPFTAKMVMNEEKPTVANGVTHTVSYEWTVPNHAQKMLFTLTTAESENAQLQVLGSAAIVGQ
jgi:hypothetical protein